MKDADGNLLESAVLQMKELGLMMVDQTLSAPIVFVEKPDRETIVRLLSSSPSKPDVGQKDRVFFNAFIFALSQKAATLMWTLFSHPPPSRLFPSLMQMPGGLDWSTHVIEPMALVSRSLVFHAEEIDTERLWEDQHSVKGRRWPLEDWMFLLTISKKLLTELGGPPTVINLGSDAIWFDTGLVSDLIGMYDSALSSVIHRKLLSNLEEENDQGILPITLLENSSIHPQTEIGEGSIIINSIIKEPCWIPPRSIIINSHLKKLYVSVSDDQNQTVCDRIVVYSCVSTDQDLKVQKGTVCFSFFLNGVPEDGSERLVERRTGTFPLYLNPKEKTSADSNQNHLEEKISSLGLSFREIQQHSVNLKFTLNNLDLLLLTLSTKNRK